MKRIIGLLVVAGLTLTACRAKNAETVLTSTVLADGIEQIQYERMCVGISIGETGYYSCFADAKLRYSKEELIDIEIIDPILLSFHASERWEGGYYVYSYREIREIIDSLNNCDTEACPEMSSIIDVLEHGLLMTQAST